MTAPATGLADADLRRLEDLVEPALRSGREEGLPVIGYGEISLVLAWPPGDPRFACKRLPPFASPDRFDAYRETLGDYLDALGAAGVSAVDTEMRPVELPEGGVVGYVVQPMLPAGELAPAILRRADPAAGHPLVEAIAAAAAAAVSPSVGLDAQLSNWTWSDAGLTYIDVSTPLLWSADGRSRLDLELLADAYPAIVRAPLRRFVAPRILDTYRELRSVYLDFAGNLLKERLGAWLPAFLDRFNSRLDDPLTEEEARRYYRSDARLWAALLRVRKLDRAWRRKVRRRPYPFLLPGRIER